MQALYQRRSGYAVAFQAERAHVGEVAFASAFGDRHDVVGVPQVAAAPVLLELAARGVVELALVLAEGFGVQAALRADAAIAQEDLFAQVAGIGSQFPLVDARVRAKCEASLGERRSTGASAPPPGGGGGVLTAVVGSRARASHRSGGRGSPPLLRTTA